MDEYFEKAETDDYLIGFWNKDSVFYNMFHQLDCANIIELACGRGRHVQKYADQASNIVLVDILDKNIEFCRNRFKDSAVMNKIYFYKNNGYDLSKLPSDTYTAVFSYDAMVHFEMIDIFNYLQETFRVLAPGGKALFHHSNNYADYKADFATGIKGRNFMSKMLFAHMADRAGLIILDQKVIDWGTSRELDCLSLLQKSNGCI